MCQCLRLLLSLRHRLKVIGGEGPPEAYIFSETMNIPPEKEVCLTMVLCISFHDITF